MLRGDAKRRGGGTERRRRRGRDKTVTRDKEGFRPPLSFIATRIILGTFLECFLRVLNKTFATACTVGVLCFYPPVDVAGRCEAERSGDGAETETRRRQDSDEEQGGLSASPLFY